jgi:hypothetical protein
MRNYLSGVRPVNSVCDQEQLRNIRSGFNWRQVKYKMKGGEEECA